MAQIKYDLSDVETGGGGEQIEPGLFKAKIVSFKQRKKNKAGDTSDIEIVLDFGKDYARSWYYALLPDAPHWDKKSHGWKLREVTDALGLPEKGALDPVKFKQYEGKEVNAKVIADTDTEGQYRAKVKTIYAPTESVQWAGAPVGGGEDDDADSSDAGGEGPYGREEIESWTDDDRKEYAEELGLEVPSGRGWSKKLIDLLVEAEEGGEPEAEAEEETEEEEETTSNPALEGIDEEFTNELNSDPEFYADWTDDDIKWLVEGLEIGGNVKTSGRGWKQKAIAAFVELAGDAGGDNAEGDDDAETYEDTTEWTLEALKEEVANRQEAGAEIEISGRVTRDKLVAALIEDDGNAKDPF